MLGKYFIDKLNRLRGTAVEGISQEAVSLLMFHNYPGNIRELENIIEHAFVLCPEGRIEVRCLPDYLSPAVPSRSAETNITTALQTAEARVILDALKRNCYNRLATSLELGIHKSTLYRKISRLGINLPEKDGRYKTTEESHKRDHR
jgi:transcriptional regulator with PAS, ATPase and Fis domain